MKKQSKLFVYLAAPVAASLLLVGCDVDAAEEEKNQAAIPSAQSTNSESKAPASGTNQTQTLTSTNAPVVSTNAPATTGTNVTNVQSLTVIQELPPALPENLKLSKGVQEIVKMAQAGVSEAVLLAFVEKSDDSFEIGAEEILYLNDIGVAQTVIAAMMNKGEATGTSSGDVQVAQTPAPEPAPASTNAAPAPSLLSGNYTGTQSAQAATQVEVTTNYVADPNAPQVVQQPVVVQQQPVVVQQPVVIEQPAVTYSYFYSSLRPYGSWVYLDSYGWCWQPTIAVSYNSWRPYSHGGRWLWTDAGWYWHSDYSWGWAPFHYGRWFCPPGRGWVWVPDYTWGPSWVTWRSSHDYYGWAPLPPRAYCRPGFGFTYYDVNVGFGFSFGFSHEHYTFVHARRFHNHRIIDHAVPTQQAANIYKDSVVVNNYIQGNNNTIINEGISRDHVSRVTRTEIQKVNIQDAPVQSGRAVPSERLVKDGSRTVVYRPQPPPIEQAKAVEARQYRQEAPKTAAVASSGSGTLVRGTPVAGGSTRPALSPRAEATQSATPSAPGRRPTAPRDEDRTFSSRTSREAAARANSETLTRQSGGTERGGTLVRPQTGSRTESSTAIANLPVPPKPAPLVRPEPAPVASARSDTPATTTRGSTAVGSGLVSTSPSGRPEPLGRPSSPVTSPGRQSFTPQTPVAPRLQTSPSAGTSRGGTLRNVPGAIESGRPATPPSAVTQPQPVLTPRAESSRGAATPTLPRHSSGVPSNSRLTESAVPGYTPSTRTDNTAVRPAAPVTTPSPSTPAARSTVPNSRAWTPPTVQSGRIASSPDLARPAPSQAPQPTVRSGRIYDSSPAPAGRTTAPSVNAPQPSAPQPAGRPGRVYERPAAPAPQYSPPVSAPSRPVTPPAAFPSQASPARMETITRPAPSAAPAPAPAFRSGRVYTPQSVTPVPSQPSFSAPRSAPPSVSVNPGPRFETPRSAPAPAPAMRQSAPSGPSAAPAPSGRGRGRVEIDR